MKPVLYHVGIVAFVLIIGGCASPRPDNLGLADGRLAPCPEAPRCVSSQLPIEDVNHNIESYDLIVPPEQAWTQLNQLVSGMPRTEIITSEPDYLYAEVRTPTLGFVDDLEFYLDSDATEIQMRSSARIGYWDWGTNRNRVDAIRDELRQAGVVR